MTHALGNGEGGFYLKEPKTQSNRRSISLTRHTFATLRAMRAESRAKMAEFGLKGDPFILGTQEPDSRPYNPTQLGKDFGAYCKMNGFKCTFHDLRHVFATMMISGGTDVRAVASYLGRASVSMTLNVYADVDPEAKKAAVSKADDAFDMDMMSSSSARSTWRRDRSPRSPSPSNSSRPCSPRRRPPRVTARWHDGGESARRVNCRVRMLYFCHGEDR